MTDIVSKVTKMKVRFLPDGSSYQRRILVETKYYTVYYVGSDGKNHKRIFHSRDKLNWFINCCTFCVRWTRIVTQVEYRNNTDDCLPW